MNQIEKTQLINELRNLFGTVGENEFELALKSAETNGTNVEEEFRQHREKHEKGRTNSLGAAGVYASADVWPDRLIGSDREAPHADLACGALLFAGTSELNVVDRLGFSAQ